MGQLHALLLWIDDRRVTWFNDREVISFPFLVLIFGSQNVWKYTRRSRFLSAIFGWLSFCKHASSRKKRLHERTSRSSGTPTSFVTETKEQFLKLRFAEELVNFSVRSLCWFRWTLERHLYTLGKWFPFLLYNYCYSACSLLINYCVNTGNFCFGNSGYFKVVYARRMWRDGDVAQRRLLSTPVYVTRKCNKTL